MLLANVYPCLAAFHGGASDPMNCTSVAIASIGKQSRRMPHAVRESFASGGMNFCLVPSVQGVSDASDTALNCPAIFRARFRNQGTRLNKINS